MAAEQHGDESTRKAAGGRREGGEARSQINSHPKKKEKNKKKESPLNSVIRTTSDVKVERVYCLRRTYHERRH